MPKFKVILREVVLYELTVEARDAEDAEAVAEKVFAREGGSEFFLSIPERSATQVTPVEG